MHRKSKHFYLFSQVLRPKEKRVYITVNDQRIDLEMRVRLDMPYFVVLQSALSAL